MSLFPFKSRRGWPDDPPSPTTEPAVADEAQDLDTGGWLASSFDLRCGLEVAECSLDSLASDHLEALIQQTVARDRAHVEAPRVDLRRHQRRQSDRDD